MNINIEEILKKHKSFFNHTHVLYTPIHSMNILTKGIGYIRV